MWRTKQSIWQKGSTQGSGSQFSRKRVQDPHTSREELYKEYNCGKTALHKSKVHRRKRYSTSLCFREGRWLFSSAHPLRNNPAAKLTLPDFIKNNKMHVLCGFFEPSGVRCLFFSLNAGSSLLTTFMFVLQLLIWRWMIIGTDWFLIYVSFISLPSFNQHWWPFRCVKLLK